LKKKRDREGGRENVGRREGRSLKEKMEKDKEENGDKR
jgi:hypothetical protein